MTKMPLLFIGHGSPLNALEDNEYTRNWKRIAAALPKPAAILAVSAHWYTDGTRINDARHPKTIYDMYGFPKELYEISYPAPGAPELAHHTRSLIQTGVAIDNNWGYDHGAWVVLHGMYPQADIPVSQLSVDANAGAAAHFEIGKRLAPLREKGVLILGSGNIVHNLSRVNFSMDGGYGWAGEFDNYIKDRIMQGAYRDVMDYRQAGPAAALAVPTPDHFDPLLYILGAADGADQVAVLNDSCIYGSLSMTCYILTNGIPFENTENRPNPKK